MKLLKNYGLSILLCILFFSSWFAQGFFQWREYQSAQREHKAEISKSDYTNEFLSATFENWQSEFLQLFSFVILSAYLIHKGSPQSKDGDDEMLARIKDIQKKLDKKKS